MLQQQSSFLPASSSTDDVVAGLQQTKSNVANQHPVVVVSAKMLS